MPSERRALDEFEKLALLVILATTGLLVLAYFTLSGAEMDETWKEFLLGVVSNLVATLLVLGAPFVLLRAIFRAQRTADVEEIRTAVAGDIAQAVEDLRGISSASDAVRPETAEIAEGLINELREAIIDGRLPLGERPPVQAISNAVDSKRRDIIGHILHATSLALIYPRSQTAFHFRAFCHLADPESKTLKPVCMWSIHHADDYNAAIPYEGQNSRPFIISKAFNEVEMVRQNLPADHLEGYSPDLRSKILPSLRSVLAVPICDYEPDSSGDVLGTISIDSTATLEVLGFDDDKVKDVLVWCAKAVYQVLTMRQDRDAEDEG